MPYLDSFACRRPLSPFSPAPCLFSRRSVCPVLYCFQRVFSTRDLRFSSVLERPSKAIFRRAVSINSAATQSMSTAPSMLPVNAHRPVAILNMATVKGHFGWEQIGPNNMLPYIIRMINGERLKFVSVRMAEYHLLLSGHLERMDLVISECVSVRSYHILKSEANLLNEIKDFHSDRLYGNEAFVAGKDYIVRIEDVIEFNLFIETCNKIAHNVLLNGSPDSQNRCGFIRINGESEVPYCRKGNEIYLPLFFFETEVDDIIRRAVPLKGWDLAYLKICCVHQGVLGVYFAGDSCLVLSLDEVLLNFSSGSYNIEFVWPDWSDSESFNNQNTIISFSPGCWIKRPTSALKLNNAPAPVVIILQNSAVPAPSLMSMANNSNQNDRSMDSAILQQQSSSRLITTPTPTSVQTVTYFPTPQVANNAPTRLSNSVGQPENQQQMIATPLSQQSNGNRRTLENGPNRHYVGQGSRMEPFRNDESMYSTIPSSNSTYEITIPHFNMLINIIPECFFGIHSTPMEPPYKIQNKVILGTTFCCINSDPFLYSKLMVPLYDIVRATMPWCPAAICAYFLNRYFDTKLYCGNAAQITLLQDAAFLPPSTKPEDTPFAMLKDITPVLSSLIEKVKSSEELVAVRLFLVKFSD